MSKIINIKARQILDSRGNPTVEADIYLESGDSGRAAVPSGASTGAHEAVELRDGRKAYNKKGVLKAVNNIENIIKPALLGIPCIEQANIDGIMLELDGTSNKKNLGANAILAVSMAVTRAASTYRNIPLFQYLCELVNSPAGYSASHPKVFPKAANLLPIPMMNVINGGEHASNNISIQEFMIVPANFGTFSRALQAGIEVFHELKRKAADKGMPTTVGDEGGIAPDLPTNESALEFIVESITSAGYTPGTDIFIALDPAASEFYRDDKYFMHGCNPEGMSSLEMVDYWQNLVDYFPIISIEDGLAEDDWNGWQLMNSRLGERIIIVGDDIFVTNPERLLRGIEYSSANAILIKLNQIGSVTETIDTVRIAANADWKTVISHRSGETEDTFISDFAVAMSTGYIKTGSGSRTDRIAKYNQLLRIEEILGARAEFMGIDGIPESCRN